MSLIEVLFATAIVAVVFMAIYGVFIVSVKIVTGSKARAGALSLAVERTEAIRSMLYQEIGTVGGIPSGTLAQSENITLNNTPYIRRTFIGYGDDPADGLGGADENGITADYKIVKVELTWDLRSLLQSYSHVTTVVPKGIESLNGGGTLKLFVYDALAQPITGATVRVVNTTGTSSIDVTTFTNSAGSVTFPGTPSGAGYQITVTKAGYTTARTYTSNASNPNPTPGDLSVADTQTTSGTFFIDRFSGLDIRTWEPIKEESWADEFTDATKIQTSASSTVTGGELQLELDGAEYWQAGSARSIAITPQYLSAWKEVRFTSATPPSTVAKVKIYFDNAGTPTILSDAVLSGNSAGFTTSPIDLSGISTSTYPTLYLVSELSTGDITVTPNIGRLEVVYDKGPTPLPNISFTLRGDKTIGTTGAGAATYKFSGTYSTGASSAFSTTTMEWDTYTLDVTGGLYDISESCQPLPLVLSPNVSTGLDLYLSPASTHSLLVAVKDSSSGAIIPDASVRLTRSGVDITKISSNCGQVFYSSASQGTVSGGNSYTLEVSKAGYTSATLTEVEISGTSRVTVQLTP